MCTVTWTHVEESMLFPQHIILFLLSYLELTLKEAKRVCQSFITSVNTEDIVHLENLWALLNTLPTVIIVPAPLQLIIALLQQNLCIQTVVTISLILLM